MAVVPTGSITTITSSANTGSQSVTVPADAEFVVVVTGGFDLQGANYFSGGVVTLGGDALSVSADGDDVASETFVMMWSRVNPQTGSQTFAWDWSGTGAITNGFVLHVAFFKVVDTADPIRWSGVDQGGTSLAATAVSGDMVVAVGVAESGAVDITWTNATEVAEASFNNETVSLAEASPSGDVTVSHDGTPFPSIAALTIRAAGTAEKRQPPRRIRSSSTRARRHNQVFT